MPLCCGYESTSQTCGFGLSADAPVAYQQEESRLCDIRISFSRLQKGPDFVCVQWVCGSSENLEIANILWNDDVRLSFNARHFTSNSSCCWRDECLRTHSNLHFILSGGFVVAFLWQPKMIFAFAWSSRLDDEAFEQKVKYEDTHKVWYFEIAEESFQYSC